MLKGMDGMDPFVSRTRDKRIGRGEDRKRKNGD